jgi:RNA 2',3'-cyclic 3'-phosphodiesterase
MERLFVAALPDADTAAALRRLPRPDERGVRWVPDENWHVTLRFLGTCDTAAVVERLGGTELPACRASLGPAVDWLGPQIVVPVSGVDGLAAAVRTATHGIGDPPERRFRGHLTIARTRRAATSSVLGHPVSGGFDVHVVTLVRSEPTPDGARYTIVTTFPTV